MRISLACTALLLAARAATATADDLAPPGTTAPSPLAVADAPPPVPSRGPRLQLAITGDLRITRLDGAAGRFVDDAMAYGWRVAQARPLYGLGVDAHYLWTPIVDVGARVGYLTQDYAAGTDPEDRMGIAWTTVAASARLRWAQGRPFIPEPRLDLGLARQTWTVHGQDDQATRSFVRVGVDWRLGTRTAGVMLALAYTLTDRPAVDGPAPPVGGLDLAIGPYLRR